MCLTEELLENRRVHFILQQSGPLERETFSKVFTVFIVFIPTIYTTHGTLLREPFSTVLFYSILGLYLTQGWGEKENLRVEV